MKRVLIRTAAIGIFLMTSNKLLWAEEAPAPGVSSSASAAQKIYIDPVTGQKGVPPPMAIAPAPTNRVGTSSEGLAETPVTTKAGGFKVHLGGRFQATITATNRADGKVGVRCASDTEQLTAKPATHR